MDKSFIGSAQLSFSTLTSTNQFAHILLSKTRPRAGTVISAAFQTAGEGQYGRSWFGSKGTNLCLSVILYPQILATAQFTLSAFVALALRDTVQDFIDKRISIKWPNDIYVEDRKIGGILIQNSLSGQIIQHSIIGIGLNVNEPDFPAALPNPTSLIKESGSKVDLSIVTHTLVAYLNDWYKRSQNLPLTMLKQQYTNNLYRFGEECPFQATDNDQIVPARITGVDDAGRLLLEFSDNGRIEAFAHNQIRQVVA